MIIVGLCVAARADTTEQSCVPEGEVKPVEIPANARALVQERDCNDMLEAAQDSSAWTSCPDIRKRIDVARAFCADPVTATTAVSGNEIAAVHVILGQKPCGTDKAGGQDGSRTFAPPAVFPSEDVLIQGLAEFVIARAKAEAMSFLIDHVADQICGNADGKHLLPATCEVLAGNPEGNTWGTLRIAIENDMPRFPERALACAAHRAGAPDGVQTLVYFGAQTARLVRDGDNLISILSGFQQDGYTADQCKADRVRCGLQIAGFTVQLLVPIEVDGKTVYKPRNKARFVGLVVRRLLDELTRLQVIDPTRLAELTKDAKALAALRARVERIHDHAATLWIELPGLQAAFEHAGTADARVAILAKLMRKALALLEIMRGETIGWLQDELADHPAARARIDRVDGNIRSGLRVVADTLDIYDKVANRKYANVYVAIALAVRALEHSGIGADLDDAVRRLLPFMCEIAAAQNSEDVQRSLEAAAAPVGGGLAKRGAKRRTVAITAFAGLAGGGELAFPTRGTSDVAVQGGAFVPVGVDVTWGFGKKQSFGVFVSAIDIGAVASFRTEHHEIVDGTTDKLETAPQIGFRQVVSPGLYVVWGVDRFAFGAGAAMSPELRRVTSDGSLVETASALRFGVFAAVDVTILPF